MLKDAPPHLRHRVVSFVEAMCRGPVFFCCKLGDESILFLPIPKEELLSGCPGDFPLISNDRGQRGFDFTLSLRWQESTWTLLKERLEKAMKRGTIASKLTAFRNQRALLPWDGPYLAQCCLHLLGSEKEARLSLMAIEKNPLNSEWLLPTAVAWFLLFGDESRAKKVLQQNSPRKDDPGSLAAYAMAAARIGQKEQARIWAEPILGDPRIWPKLPDLAEFLNLFWTPDETREKLTALTGSSRGQPQGVEPSVLASVTSLVLGDLAWTERLIQQEEEASRQKLIELRLRLLGQKLPFPGPLDGVKMEDFGSTISFESHCARYFTLTEDRRGMEELLSAGLKRFRQAVDIVEIARIRATYLGIDPEVQRLVERAEAADGDSFAWHQIAEIWAEFLGNQEKSARASAIAKQKSDAESADIDPCR